MTNDRKDEAPAGSAEEWPKRAGPTIDLDASDVSGDTQASGGTNAAGTFFRRVTGGSRAQARACCRSSLRSSAARSRHFSCWPRSGPAG